MYEKICCHNLENNPFTESVTVMFERRDIFKAQRIDLLQSLAKKIGLSVHAVNNRIDIYEVNKCVTETWMTENFDDRVKEVSIF